MSAPAILRLERAQITDLSEIGHMTSLRELILTRTPVSDLTPLAGLHALQSLIDSYPAKPPAGVAASSPAHVPAD